MNPFSKKSLSRFGLTVVVMSSLFFHAHISNGQGYLRAHGKEIVNESGEPVLLRGMGLGGWMLQEGYMLQTASFANSQHKIRAKIEELIGEEDTDRFYELWLANHVRKIDIDSLKSWGFNSVRLPMHYNLFTLPIEEEPVQGQNTWLETGFALTDSLLEWCQANEMYLILDLHAAPGGQGKDEGISDYDPNKPSLWESELNQQKTVALWQMLAARYADEPWIGGYDLINETNWEMDGNVPLYELYRDITDAIREVDTTHILFIEGNWFANDFTGLTPPWDDNMVYSPHKYWSINDQASIQWVLDIREQYNVPLYFGESGENSNVWFRDAIRLMEDYNIGWAWWPMKKIESIAGPLSVIKTPGYQSLLDYWEGGGSAPTHEEARDILFDLAEKLKLEHCVYQKDVIDAMIRQVYDDNTLPFTRHNIPGIVHAPDFDLGREGYAYHDLDHANYQVSTGQYTAWNNGWIYRNDGVDIEKSQDAVNTNGYNVGWNKPGEWIQYTFDLEESSSFDVRVRVASLSNDGKFHLGVGNAAATSQVEVPNTGDWQSWQSVTVRDIVLTPEDGSFRFFMDQGEFNLGSFEFILNGSSADIRTEAVSARTLNEYDIQLNFNKPLSEVHGIGDFTIQVNGTVAGVESFELESDFHRSVRFRMTDALVSSDEIVISYSGSDITATDETPLRTFSDLPVENRVFVVHNIPGKVESEDFFHQEGTQLETTTDNGGGQNISWLDEGDYLDYIIKVRDEGEYMVTYRTASLEEGGGVSLWLVQDDAMTYLHQVSFPPTGDWQDWTNTSELIDLPAGIHVLRMRIEQSLFNMNYMVFSSLTGLTDPNPTFSVHPNPSTGVWTLSHDDGLEIIKAQVYTLSGQSIAVFENTGGTIDLTSQPNGVYVLKMQMSDGTLSSCRLIKVQ